MPSLRARIAAYRARVRFAGQKALSYRRSVGRIHRSTGPSRPKGFRARLQKYNVHSYKRYATPISLTAAATSTAYNNVLYFQLAGVRGASELTALYDQYMITGVKVRFQMVTNPDSNYETNNVSNTNASNFYPKLFYTRDYDNDAVESTNDLRERNTTKMKVLRPNSVVDIFLKPAVRNLLYLDGVTAANSPLWHQWLDCSSSQVPHYGLKFSVDFNGFTTSDAYEFRIETIYYLKFKNTR